MKPMRLLALIVLIAGVLLVRASLIKIGPDEIGVRTRNFGQGHGIDDQDYGPGYHRNLWPLDTWNRFPSTVQRIRFGKEDMMRAAPSVGELQLTSADGDRVMLTLEVVYRIADGQAHRVLQDSGSGVQQGSSSGIRYPHEEVVRNLSQDAARVEFGRLRTEGFYDEASREKSRLQAVALLRDKLRPRGIELVDLLVETIEFDPNYESLIKQKKIADQQVELEKAKAHAAEETGKVAKIRAETTVKVTRIDREAEAEVTRRKTETDMEIAGMAGQASKYATQKLADGTLYESHKKAEGQLALKLAQAEGTQRLNSALVGDGGQNLVALEAAKSLNLTDVTFPSFGYEWFNPHEMALRLGGAEKENQPTSAPAAADAAISRR